MTAVPRFTERQHDTALLSLVLAVCALAFAAVQPVVADDAKTTRSTLEPTEEDRAEWLALREERRARKQEVLREIALTGPKDETPTEIAFSPASPTPDYALSNGYESFEGAFNTWWLRGDLNSTDGDVYWADAPDSLFSWLTAHDGSWVAWCADIGGSSSDHYDDNMDAYLAIECEYLGLYGDGTNGFGFRFWNEPGSDGDYCEFIIEGFVELPPSGFGAGTPDESASFHLPDSGGSGWSLVGTTMGTPWDACNYIRVSYRFYSNASGSTNHGTALDFIEFNNQATKAIYPIENGFPSPAAGLSARVSGTFNSTGEWCYVAYWDGKNVTYTDWQVDGEFAWQMGVPFDTAVSAWLYSDTASGYVEALQAYKWNLRP